jgi:hypothetical protein
MLTNSEQQLWPEVQDLSQDSSSGNKAGGLAPEPRVFPLPAGSSQHFCCRSAAANGFRELSRSLFPAASVRARVDFFCDITTQIDYRLAR